MGSYSGGGTFIVLLLVLGYTGSFSAGLGGGGFCEGVIFKLLFSSLGVLLAGLEGAGGGFTIMLYCLFNLSKIYFL